MNDFYKDAEVTTSLKPGAPGTIKLAKKKQFSGNFVRLRYYKNNDTGEIRKTIEVELKEEGK